MCKVKNINLFLLLISLISISGLNPFKRKFNKSRYLEEVINIDFVNAINLSFNSGWSFDIKYYSSNKLLKNTLYSTSILYKGNPSLAKCYVSSDNDYLLNCLVNEEGQTQKDLIQINNALADGSTINFQNLTKVYDIPINTTLKYKDSFSLTYHYNYPSVYYDFKVELSEDVLPENAVVKIDLFLNSKLTTVSLCTHKSRFLDCEFNATRKDDYLVKISPSKDKGSIEWENLQNNVTIPFTCIASVYSGATELELVNNQWTYTLQARCQYTKMASQTLITVDTKIEKKNGNTGLYFTECYLSADESLYFNCTVIGENQELSDLVYITTGKEHEISVDLVTKNPLKNDEIIIRNAELSFSKVYDLIFDVTERSWNFKIDLKDENNLPEKALVDVDIWIDTNNGNIKTSCSFSNITLSCATTKSSVDSTVLIRLIGQKNKGTVNWINTKDKYIPIAMRHTLTINEALGGFYTDRFHCLISVVNKINTPKYSNVIAGIIVDGKVKSATCTILEKRSLYDNEGYVYCVTDIGIQPSTITWDGLTSENGKIHLLDTSKLVYKELKFIDAYDMYFAENQWIFTILSWDSDTSKGNNRGEVGAYKVDIKVNGNTQSTAICLNYDGIEDTTNIRFICKSEHSNQKKDDLIKISHERPTNETIYWKVGLTEDYTIALKANLTIKRGYDLMKVSNRWQFKIEIVPDDQAILPLNSKVVVDVTQSPYIANCTVESSSLLSCKSDVAGSVEPKLDYYKSLQSTVNWTNVDKDDYFMISTANLQFLSANYLYFQEDKWRFNLSVSSLNSAKVIIDILYGDEASTATCTGGKNYLINCIVDKENQEPNVLIKLKKDKPQGSTSTVTWTSGLNNDIDIPLYTELNYVEARNLKFVNNNWNFDIEISDENIPLNAYIIVDIELLYFYGSKTSYTKKISSIANCYQSQSKLFNCDVVVNRNNYNSYEYAPTLVKIKNPSTISSVIQWKNMPSDIVSIPLVATLNYNLNSKIISEDGNYYTYIELQTDTKIPKDSICTITLLNDNTEELSNCVAQNHTSLKCQISNYASDKKIYIKKDKLESATITWSNLAVNQNLFPIKLTYIHAYNFKFEQYYYIFTILVQKEADDNTLTEDLIIPVKIRQKVNAKISTISAYDKINIIPCKYDKEYLSCTWKPNGEHIDPDKDLFNLELESTGDLIEWQNPGQKEIDLEKSYGLKYKKLLLCEYDSSNNYYKFSIELDESVNKGDIIVTDLKINNENNYGICIVKEAKVIDCHTPAMTNGGESDTIFILKDKIKGNIYWRNSLSADKQIYPNTIVYLNVDKIYDLTYNTNKWEFKIKYDNTISFGGASSKQIDIFIDKTTKGTASCTIIESNKLQCISDTELANNQLITLNSEATDENIILYNLRYYTIPLKATLEFVSSSGLKYNNGWSFLLKVKNTNTDFVIPSGSTFSVDILYDTNKPELAFCTETGTRDNNGLNLICVPQNEIADNYLIKLSTTKDAYSSVTWSTEITSDNAYIYLDLDLYIEYVTIPEYSENKNTFKMIFNDNNILPGTKALVDISYNGQDALANCVLSGEESKTFVCTPDINTQSGDDTISIIFTKKNGNINYKNPQENLQFLISLFYSKASNLKFNSNKWNFDIALSQSNIKDGKEILIDILVDNNPGKAKCTLNSNTLNCEVQENNQLVSNVIKIKNVQSNSLFKWNDIPDEVTLYIDYNINLINAYGGLYKGKWGFYIIYQISESETNDYTGQNVLLDILVNNLQSTVLCNIKETSYLVCTPNNNNQISSIKLYGSKKEGTVSFNTELTNEQKELNPISFSLNYESKEYKFNENNNIEFTLKGKLGENINYKFLEKSYTELEIINYISDINEELKTVHCITNEINKAVNSDVTITCETDIRQKANIKLEIDNDSKYSGFVKIITTLDEIEISNINDNTDNDNNSSKNYRNNLLFMFLILLLI